MPKMEITPFQSVTLELSGVEHAAQILGLNDRSMVLQVPTELAEAKPDGAVMLKFAAQGYYYQVSLPVETVHQNWWFLPLPLASECQRVQRRTFVRIQFDALVVAMPITPSGEPNGDLTTITLANLSADGCYALAQEAWGASDSLLIFLSLPDLPTMNLVGTIVRSQLGEEGYWYGMKFENLAREHQDQLISFINAEIQAGQELGVDIVLPG